MGEPAKGSQDSADDQLRTGSEIWESHRNASSGALCKVLAPARAAKSPPVSEGREAGSDQVRRAKANQTATCASEISEASKGDQAIGGNCME
jgi:hypothetical protein